MTCTCPKCRANIEIDLPEVAETGTPASCPACNAKFTVYRESFGSRALHKSGEISCAACGAQLGPQLHCSTCGARFPDFLVVSMGRKKVRRTSPKVKLKSSPFPKKSSTQLPSLDFTLKPEGAKGAPAAGVASRFLRPQVIVAVVLLLAVIAGGVSYYLKITKEKTYEKSFVLASYCLQTGIERAQKATAKKAAEWKEKLDQGQAYTPRSSMEDERDFGIINGRLDPALAKLSEPPAKFASCNDKINRLQGVYNKMRTLALAPGTSLPAFQDNIVKLDNEYKQAVKEYRSEMPAELTAELNSASFKFKGLRPLLR